MKKAISLLVLLALSLSLAVGAAADHIVYWSMWESTEAQGQVIQKAIDQFVADTGHTVDVQFKGRTGQREGLQPALDAGTVIDLFDEARPFFCPPQDREQNG